MEILRAVVAENPVWRWLAAAAIVALVWIVLRTVTRRLTGRLRPVAKRTPGRFDDLVIDLIEKTRFPFILVLALYGASLTLVLPDAAKRAMQAVFIFALLLQSGHWAAETVTFWIHRTARRKLAEDPAAATSLSALGFIVKVIVWTIVGLLALDNFGINITALVAGLGIGGIAIALAVQSILGDLFASLSILVDKPFVIGDFIIVGDLMGNVERIGLKTTRVRSLSGEQIVISNSDVLASRVRNYKRMYERRIVFGFGVTYQTSPDLLEGIPAMVREIIEAQPDVRFDRCHFKSFGSFSLDFETVFYILVSDYGVYMDRQQAINLAIVRAFEERGIAFAYPTQTLYIGRAGASEQQ